MRFIVLLMMFVSNISLAQLDSDLDMDGFPDDPILLRFVSTATAGGASTLRTRWDINHPQGSVLLDFRLTLQGWAFAVTTSRYPWEELGYPYLELGNAVADLLNQIGARYPTADYRNQKLLLDYFYERENIFEFFDAFPNDATEWFDNDLDGLGNNADHDDDNDGCDDGNDVFPLDSKECLDSDEDGVGDKQENIVSLGNHFTDLLGVVGRSRGRGR
jgi:hypothetical protein